jgi:hypothetical protein
MWWVMVGVKGHVFRVRRPLAVPFRARPVEFLRVIPLLVRLLQKEQSFESATTDALRASEGNRRARHQDGPFRFGDE